MSNDIPTGLLGPKGMEPDPHKRKENQLRRAARAKGLTLVKSRSRKQDSPLYGTYMLINAKSEIVHSGSGTDTYGLSLDDVAEYLGQ